MNALLKDNRTTRLFWVEDDFFDNGVAAAIGASAALLYLALCRHANKEGMSFPSIARLATETGLSERTISNGIKCLKDKGLVNVTRDRDGHTHQHNVYHLNSPKKLKVETKRKKVVKEDTSAVSDKTAKVIDATPVTSSSEEGLKDTTPSNSDGNLVFPENWKAETRAKFAMALEKLPASQRQSVLDEFLGALQKREIRVPLKYLQTMVENKLTEVSIPKLPAQTQTRTHIADKVIEKKPDCPFCDESGFVHFVDSKNRRAASKCGHSEDMLKQFAEKHNLKIEVGTAKNRTRVPSDLLYAEPTTAPAVTLPPVKTVPVKKKNFEGATDIAGELMRRLGDQLDKTARQKLEALCTSR